MNNTGATCTHPPLAIPGNFFLTDARRVLLMIGCSIAGSWVQEQSGDTFGPITEDKAAHSFHWLSNP